MFCLKWFGMIVKWIQKARLFAKHAIPSKRGPFGKEIIEIIRVKPYSNK